MEGGAVDTCASLPALSLGIPRRLEPWLPQMSESAPPPMTSVTVVLGHPPWHQPMATPRAARTLTLPPVALRRLLGVISARPSCGALTSLLRGVKLSIPLGLFAYTHPPFRRWVQGADSFSEGVFL